MLSDSELNTLINAARYAPSADNGLPFLYRSNKDGSVTFFTDKERSGDATDKGFGLSDIALGAVIENVSIKAQSMGLETNISYFPSKENKQRRIADITFSKSTSETSLSNSLADAIPKRCTDRRFPFKGPVNDEILQRLKAAVEYHDCELVLYTDKQAKNSVLPVIQKAESIRFESEILHKELFSTVNFTDPEPLEGMPVSTLAIEAPARPFFKLMSNWRYMKLFNKIGASKMLGLRSVRVPIAFSPVLVLIKIKSNNRLDVVKGGQALQRLWLQAAADNLSVQPYAAPGVFSLGHLEIERELMGRVEEVQSEMRTIVSNEGNGLMFLRLGFHNSPVKHRTLRRPVESFKKS